jgi:hypothetical protein
MKTRYTLVELFVLMLITSILGSVMLGILWQANQVSSDTQGVMHGHQQMRVLRAAWQNWAPTGAQWSIQDDALTLGEAQAWQDGDKLMLGDGDRTRELRLPRGAVATFTEERTSRLRLAVLTIRWPTGSREDLRHSARLSAVLEVFP